jgi:hypothetical protein
MTCHCSTEHLKKTLNHGLGSLNKVKKTFFGVLIHVIEAIMAAAANMCCSVAPQWKS